MGTPRMELSWILSLRATAKRYGQGESDSIKRNGLSNDCLTANYLRILPRGPRLKLEKLVFFEQILNPCLLFLIDLAVV